jgi:Calx-beta domain
VRLHAPTIEIPKVCRRGEGAATRKRQKQIMRLPSLRFAVLLSLLLLVPLAGRPQEPPEIEWGPVQEDIYAGSRLLAITPPNARPRRSLYDLALPEAPIVVSEGAGAVKIPVRLTTPTGDPTEAQVTVKYATTSGSAKAGEDFTPTSGVLVFPALSPSGTTLDIEVPILDNATTEPGRTFQIVLSDPEGALVATASTQTIVIEDDDTEAEASGGEPL